MDVTWCFYAGEEVAQEFNGLGHLWERRPDLLAADAAILGEPTGGLVEAGCQGTLRVRIRLAGERAHTARPHTGRNAIHRLAPVLTAVAGFEVRRPVIDGCEYAEQLQVVSVEGGVAANVVPDEAVVVVNHRFAPDRTVEQAESAVRELLAPHLEPGDHWELLEASPGAPPSLDHPVLAALVAATGVPPRAKVGWTDVASFWAARRSRRQLRAGRPAPRPTRPASTSVSTSCGWRPGSSTRCCGPENHRAGVHRWIDRGGGQVTVTWRGRSGRALQAAEHGDDLAEDRDLGRDRTPWGRVGRWPGSGRPCRPWSRTT